MRLEDRGKNLWATFTADMQRYAPGKRPWSLGFIRSLIRSGYEHPGMWAVVVYRFGQFVYFRCRIPILRQILDAYYYYLYTLIRTRLQIEVPRTSCIDAGFRIDHYGSIIINCQIIAGKNLTITHGVLVGQTDTGVPVIGDNVEIGAGARIIGGVHVGDYALIGASALVCKDVPERAVVAGVPARVLRYRDPCPPHTGARA